MTVEVTRRKLITSLAGGALALAASPAMAKLPKASDMSADPVRTLSFVNTHTGERAKKITYFEYGNYVPDALAELNNVLRDHRSNDVAKMDPKLMDLLYTLHGKLDSNEEFKVISAYRSPKTNAMLAARSGGVAKKSYHMKGMAMDMALADRSLADIKKAALAMRAGGVGKYDLFVHVDTGPVRTW